MALQLLVGAFMVGSAVAGIASEAAAAKAKNKLNQELYARQAAFLQEGYRQNAASLVRREEAQRFQDAYTAQDVERDALNVAGRTRTQASASNLNGTTVDTLISLVARQELDFKTRLESQQSRRGLELQSSLEALQLNVGAELTSLQPNHVPGPDLLSSIFKVGSAGLSGFSQGSALQSSLASHE